ncbi:membrane protein [Mycolicibacterium rutilum]|uniref:Membrane protein n=1 Tax=Mycolicibacterium rutilum TaxID=370526 RepID=A0A1H6KMH1_MYCRU|nr:MmpS family transport accessory protein [Mycolicibacterium rutilum]SEH72757.1 membrane protein [Mycolicibacterium rutilum]
MTDTPGRGRDEQRRDEAGYPYSGDYSGYSDPAYASQAYGPTYQPPGPAPTQQLPPYSQYGYDPYASGQYSGQFGSPPYPPGEPNEPPDEPKSPRWLWILAGVAVLTVIGLVIALVIVNSSRQQTVVAPPPMQEPSFTTAPPTTSRTPTTVPRLPLPTLPSRPTVPTVPSTPGRTTPGVTETVVYVVSGTGRAINITYVDSGGLLQTEFNVLLPWSKEVQLSEPAAASASVSIINVGREVNCSITVDGALVQQRTGAGLTICTGSR